MENKINMIFPYYIDENLYTRVLLLYPASLKTKNGTKWGYINQNGEFVIKLQFNQAQDFQENGLAIVSVADGTGVINGAGEFVVKPKFNGVNPFSEGRAIVITDQGFQVINEKGRVLTKKAYSFINSYQGGRALFSGTDENNNYLYGYLDRNGNEVIPLKYPAASDFHNGRAVVQLKEKEFALIDLSGKVIVHYDDNFVGNYGDGLLVFQKEKDDLFGYMNEKGKIMIPPKFEGANGFENGVAIIHDIDDYLYKYGLIDKKGKLIFKPEYHDLIIIGEDRIAVGKAINKEKPYLGNKYAIANTNGQFLSFFIYNHVTPYEKGYASTSNNQETFFINKNGQRATHLPSVKGSGSLFLEGQIIKAVVNMRTFYLDRNGEIVWKQNTVIPLDKQYKIIEKLYNPNMDYIIYYPQLEGLVAATEEKVNQKLEALSIVEVKPYTSYSGDFEVAFFQKDLLVLELNGYEYPFGAAHGMPTMEYPNINLETGQFYELKDLFKENSNYVKILSDIIGEQIKNNEEYSYVFPDAYKGISANQPFYVTANELVIYFKPYEIAPYAAGFPTFKIPYAEIDQIIDKQGTFWMAFH